MERLREEGGSFSHLVVEVVLVDVALVEQQAEVVACPQNKPRLRASGGWSLSLECTFGEPRGG